MKTLIISAFSVETQFIKNALSELQIIKTDKFSWYKGKFYTKELYLMEYSDDLKDIATLLDLLVADGGVSQVILIGLGCSLNNQLRNGDILVNDQPTGSCQKMVDLFLGEDELEEEAPLRIFAGQIFNEFSEDKAYDNLACRDLVSAELVTSLRNKGISTLNVRLMVPEDDENLYSEVYTNIAQKLLMLLKKSVEQTS